MTYRCILVPGDHLAVEAAPKFEQLKPRVVGIHLIGRGMEVTENGATNRSDVSVVLLLHPENHEACRALYDALTAAVDMIPGGWCYESTG